MNQKTLDWLKKRFPPRREILLVFAACLFPIHIWAIVLFLVEVPALIHRASTAELLGVFAYVLVVALVESIVLLCSLVLLCIILPSRFFRDKFVSQGTMYAFITSAWAMSIHPQGIIILEWHLVPLMISLAIATILIHRIKQLDIRINSFVERLSVLSFIYIIIDIVSVFIVAFRNLF